MANQKSNAVAVSQNDVNTALATFTTEHDNLVHVRKEVLGIPRLKLMQKGTGTVGELGKPGDFICENKNINFGQSVNIIPIFADESASLMEEGSKKPICKTSNLIYNQDGAKCVECPYGSYWNKWGEDGSSPKCKTSIDVFCFVGEQMEPMFLSFRKTSYAAGKDLIRKISNDKAPFASSYTLISKDDNKKGHDFKKISDTVKQNVLDNDTIMKLLPIAKKFAEMRKQGTLEREELVDDDVNSPAPSSDDVPL